MGTEQEYYKKKKALEEAQRQLKDVSQPQLTDTEHIFVLHETLYSRKNGVLSSSEREEFIACMLLLYSPLTLWENKHCSRGVNNALANTLGVSRPVISRCINNLRVRYKHNHEDLRERTEFIYNRLRGDIYRLKQERI